MSGPLDVAIIGLAGVYPGAADARAYWQNICAKVDAISDGDPEWAGYWYEPGTQADDRTYTVRGGFLRELAHVDPLEVGIMPSVAAGSDPDHLITLKMARDALADAGLDPARIDGRRAGVVIARGTYGNRGIASMMSRGFFMDQMMEVVRTLRPDFTESEVRALKEDLKKQLLPYSGEMVGVLTPNVIASMIANRLDFMGPAYIVDAACASSLIALDGAVQELVSGRCDLMLVGGTQVQTPAPLFIQFCQINALSRDRLRPFQKGAEGTLLGEGCGVMVLKRLADAERDGDRIYAVIKGIGTSSDGKAKGLLAPRMEGQVLAMQRAYDSSGIDPRTVDLIEAHGTGTSVGDATEIESLSAVFGSRGMAPQIAISAVKSMIGHCLPATGTASMIKTALALHHKVLPPMLCDEPDPALHLDRTPFYINTQTRPWIHGGDTPRRAGVNAFGFGGINAHVILEEYAPRASAAPVTVRPLDPPAGSELVLLAADTPAQLVAQARAALAHLRASAPAGLAQIAKAAAQSAAGRAHRLAIVAESAADLTTKLEQALEKLAAPNVKPFKTRNGVQYGHGALPGKLCVLFPGEGSQYPGMLADVCLHFPQVRAWFDFIEEHAHAHGGRSRAQAIFPAPTLVDEARRAELEQALHGMDLGAESVFAANLGLQSLFESLGLQPDAMLGHSTGENTALTACRGAAFEQRQLLAEAMQEMHAIFRRLDTEGRIVSGTLLTVGGLTRDTRASLLAALAEPGSALQLAMDNCPNQVVVFGTPEATRALRESLATQGAICQELPFGRAYHTPLFKPLADAFREYFKTLEFAPGRVALYSARSGGLYPDGAEAMRELAAQQWEHPVRFTETIERLYADGFRVFLEVGPSATLSAFVSDTLRGKSDVLSLSANSRRKPGLLHLQQTLGSLFAAGADFDASALYTHRNIAALDLYADPVAPKKSAPRRALTMPAVTLPEKWKRPLPATAGAAAPPATGGLPSVLASPAPAPSVSDPRLAAVQAHFSLMREFLDSQARVLGLATGASAGAPTELRDTPAPYPLLGEIVEQHDGRMVFERSYSVDADLFLRDHCIGGMPSTHDATLHAIPVMPFTYSLEICAQAAARLIARDDRVVIALENARGSRWLALDEGRLRLRIVAERSTSSGNEDLVSCRLFLLDQGGPVGGIAVFETQVRLASAYPAAPGAMPWTSADRHPPRHNADNRLYARGMFHGPRLQGGQRIEAWGEHNIDMQLQVIGREDYFAFTRTPRLQTDATLSDVLGQTLYWWVQERHGGKLNVFPFQIAKLSLYAPPPPAGSTLYSRARVGLPAPQRLEAEVEARDTNGRVLMRAEGWEDRTFDVSERFFEFRLDPPRRFLGETWMDGLLPPGLCARRMPPFEGDLLDSGGGIWGRSLAHMVLTPRERAQFYALPASGPRRQEWLMGRIAAKEAARDWFAYKHALSLASADIEIVQGERGAPAVHCAAAGNVAMPCVSISHSRRWAAAVVAEPGLAVGFDYQRLDHLRADDLIHGGFSAGEHAHLAHADADIRALIAAALWCAKEAAAKASGLGLQGRPLDWTISHCALDPRRVGVGSARVQHAGRDYDVAIQFEGREAISALCLTPADGVPIAAA